MPDNCLWSARCPAERPATLFVCRRIPDNPIRRSQNRDRYRRIFSVLLFLVNISDIEVNTSDIDHTRLAANGINVTHPHEKTKVIYLTGPVFFITTEKIKAELEGLEEMDYVIFSMRGVPLVDTTGTQFFGEMCQALYEQGTRVMFLGLQPKVMSLMERSGVVEQLGENHFFWSVEQSLIAIEERHLAVS